jgi:DNA polymerase-3 subunit epsilon
VEIPILLIVLIGVVAWYYGNKKAEIVSPPRFLDLTDEDGDGSGRWLQPELQAAAPGRADSSGPSDIPIQNEEVRQNVGKQETAGTRATNTSRKPSKGLQRPTLHLPATKSQKGVSGPRQHRGERVVVIDLETTGLSPGQGARIIEISAREIIDGELGESFETFVNPGIEIPSEITAITGINSDMIRTAPQVEQVTERFLQFLATSPVIGHNIAFDLRFCRFQMGLAEDTLNLCTLLLARRLYPGHNSYKLGIICQTLGIVTPVRLHRAAADTLLTAELFRRIRADADARWGGNGMGVDSLAALQRLQARKVDKWFAANADG